MTRDPSPAPARSRRSSRTSQPWSRRRAGGPRALAPAASSSSGCRTSAPRCR
jgi:hypothetical protein